MISRRNISKSLLTTNVSNSTRNVLNPLCMWERTHPNMIITAKASIGDTSISSVLTLGQYKMLHQIHTIYTLALAMREYDKLSPDYDQYLTLLNDLNTIDTTDPTMKLLIGIVEKTLIGCMNITTVYENSIYNELQIHILTNRINDILSNKNTIDIIADPTNISGQLTIQKTFKLSKIYSYYIHLFGMPEFGVGFDLHKLKILQKSMGMFNLDPMNQIGTSVSEDPTRIKNMLDYVAAISEAITVYKANIANIRDNFIAAITADNSDESIASEAIKYNEAVEAASSSYKDIFSVINNKAANSCIGGVSDALIAFNESITYDLVAFNSALTAAICNAAINHTSIPEKYIPAVIPEYSLEEVEVMVLLLDVRVLNNKLGMQKDASNVWIFSPLVEYYDTSSFTFIEDTMTISANDIKTAIIQGQLTGGHILSTCYQNFSNFFNVFLGNTGEYLPVHDVSYLSQLLVSGEPDSRSGIYIPEVAHTLRELVKNNNFENRPVYSSPIQGWAKDDIFYIPTGGITITFSANITQNSYSVPSSEMLTIIDQQMNIFNEENGPSNVSILSNTMSETSFSQTYSIGLFIRLVNI